MRQWISNVRGLGLLTALALGGLACGDSESSGGSGGGGSDSGGGGSAGAPGSGGEGGGPSGGGMAGSPGTGGGPIDTPVFETTAVGTPDWEPVDYHQFSVELGTQFENFPTITASLLPPPNHEEHPQLGIGPGAPHPGPYDTELAAGVAANGYVDQASFPQQECLLPNGIMAAWMTVPGAGAPMGSSPDSTSGPIIPNTLFPIVVTVDAYQDGVILDGYSYEVEVPPLDGALDPPFDVDGHSHFPFFNVIYFDGAAVPGTIETRIQMRDAAGEGWDIVTLATALP